MLATIVTLIPAFIVIGLSAVVGRRTLSSETIKALSDLTFVLFMPALLFRSMLNFDFNLQNAQGLLGYFIPTVALFLAIAYFAKRKLSLPIAHGATLGLTGTFSNTVQMGIPLTTLAFGTAGLTILLSVIAIHALIVLTLATVLTEYAQARRDSASTTSTIGSTIKAAVIHPVILPIIVGLIGGAFGLVLPKQLDDAIRYLGDAAGPLCLVLLGAQLGNIALGAQAKFALTMSALKLLVHPLVVGISLYTLGIRGLPLYVLTATAALPTGTNAFLFAQRYNTQVESVTATIALSTLVSAFTYTIILILVKAL
jgi:malonate transporter and related proteins